MIDGDLRHGERHVKCGSALPRADGRPQHYPELLGGPAPGIPFDAIEAVEELRLLADFRSSHGGGERRRLAFGCDYLGGFRLAFAAQWRQSQRQNQSPGQEGQAGSSRAECLFHSSKEFSPLP